MPKQSSYAKKTDFRKMTIAIAAIATLLAIPTVSKMDFGPNMNSAAQQQRLAYGGHAFDRERSAFPDKSQAAHVSYAALFEKGDTPSQSITLQVAPGNAAAPVSAESIPACGRGRYRHAPSGRCVGPADRIS
jgi:hypothetical protein